MNDLPVVHHRPLVPEQLVALGTRPFGRIVGHLLGLERALLLLVDGFLDRVLLQLQTRKFSTETAKEYFLSRHTTGSLPIAPLKVAQVKDGCCVLSKTSNPG